MIEVSLYVVPAGEITSMVGRCVARSRFSRESLGVSVMEFVKGFLKENLEKFENGIGNDELSAIINSNRVFSTRDFSCINYYLGQAGYKVMIFNVADDEENPVGVPSGEVIEWNVIDRNFIQNDYPTATKIIPAEGTEIPAVLRQIVEQSGLFSDRFRGLKNPFKELLDGMDRIKKATGSVNSSITTKIYSLLSQLGIDVFCATSED